MEIDTDYLGSILMDIEDRVEYADIRAGTSRTSSILMKDGNLQVHGDLPLQMNPPGSVKWPLRP